MEGAGLRPAAPDRILAPPRKARQRRGRPTRRSGRLPTTTPLLDRLRTALAPDYEVERELAAGGMGIVFLGRDCALERPVAIKVLRPEHATAAATERFLREARILASLSHPNVVAVHRAGESGGLSWYVMDYLPAETLAGRLARGPLPAAEAVAVARDVLAALVAAHRRGVVHRDVKPANVFLLQGRAVLGDFGIASSPRAGEPLTLPGRPLGTPDYMAPEQMVGKPATAATDLCGVGLVLFEALTGERYESWESPARADWTRVPRPLVPVLRRALALDPEARWRDAASFAAALRTFGRVSRARRLLWAGAAVAVVAAGVAAWLALRRPSAASGALQVVVRPFRVTGPRAPAWLGDSLARALVSAFGANPDFQVRLAAGPHDTAGALSLEGRATVSGDSLALEAAASGAPSFRARARGRLAAWEPAAGRLAYEVLLDLWSERNAALAADLPRSAAPRSPEGLRAFLRAELLFAHAQWAAAYDAYERTAALDPTCLICAVRLDEVGRWLGRDPDTAVTGRYRAALDSFPPHYRELLASDFRPAGQQIEALRALTTRFRDWGFGWFVLGDQIFHRGPFEGIPRAAALRPLETASVLRPDFAPVWEHLAWVATAEGDSASAATALVRYAAIASSGDAAALTIGGLLRVAFAWRFGRAAEAAGMTDQMLRHPAIAAARELAAAPAFLLTFDAPRGAVYVGERYAAGIPRRGLEMAGSLGQVYGLTALGRPDSAVAVARRLAASTGDPDLALFADELPAALALADSADVAARWRQLAAPLEPAAYGVGRATPLRRARAAWMLALLAYRARRGAEFDRYRAVVVAAGPVAAPLADLLTIVAGRAGHGMPAAALGRSAALTALDSANRGGDPFYRGLLHLARATWQVEAGRPALGAAELRWHEANDFVGYPGSTPQGGEVDYALGTLARWDRSRLLADLGPDYRDETCRTLAAVARNWRGGEPRFAARADSARARAAARGCGRAP